MVWKALVMGNLLRDLGPSFPHSGRDSSGELSGSVELHCLPSDTSQYLWWCVRGKKCSLHELFPAQQGGSPGILNMYMYVCQHVE